ncbi:MAG: hypothetical protein J7L82_00145 [Staphylothermus sp.]|nr:hypothetical protein [Staphylothermus sp.]
MPGFLITTSHKPSQRTRSFVKDFVSILPNSTYINRGKKTIEELGLEAYRRGYKYFIIVGERKGNPSLMRIYKIFPYNKPPEIKHIMSVIIKGITLSRENPDASRVYNPETIGVNYDKCEQDQCFKLADLFIEVFQETIVPKPDITIMLIEKKDHILLKAINKLGKTCGPLVRIKGVKYIE